MLLQTNAMAGALTFRPTTHTFQNMRTKNKLTFKGGNNKYLTKFKKYGQTWL
jgi:hypothetical protein